MLNVSVVVPHTIGAETIEEGIALAAEAGADAVELYDLDGHTPEELRDVADGHGVEFGATLAHGETPGIGNVSPAIGDPATREQSIADLEASIETAAALGAAGLVVTVGQRQDTLARHDQFGAVVDALRAVAPVAESVGVTLLPEMLNRRVDHPGYLLETSTDGYRIVKAVDSPAVKVLFDIYHQQITEGNIIQNLRENIEHIGHLHVADVPGREQPGTGELRYQAIFEALVDLGYDGYVGCEFWSEGDQFEAVKETVSLAKGA